MRIIRRIYISVSVVILMILRLFVGGDWIGSVVVGGVFVALVDTIAKIIGRNDKNKGKKCNERFAVVIIIMTLISLITLAVAIINAVTCINWLRLNIVLDELTLLALLICLSQDLILGILDYLINK